ncbi:protein O-mannosyl-transferase TMTC3-like [Ruditapes philippinarum]|uniref:protein O-mannosyl-transferase TMTC3-like n=1 Tax=Ruditapes philippinarum TaxID=129788 RepID=UPI00295AC4D0|nr:protein O-mannosyl-transferase TMTC3-like [Ruditapes philippinarum]
MAQSADSSHFFLYSLILCVTVGVCYIPALDCGFVFDDISAIVDNKDLRPRTPVSNLFLNDFWGTPMSMERSHKSYRPLCVLTFRFNYMLSELEPMSYHLLNIILHAIVCIMYMKMCNMFIPELPSFVAAMLFAVHPIHTEAVTGVVGRAESLSSIFFIAALMFYAKCTSYHRDTAWGPLFTTVGLVTIAMLCKEQGITVIGVCVVYELFVAQRALFKDLWAILMRILQGDTNIPKWLQGSIIRSVVLVGSTLFLLIARIKVMGAQLPVFTKFDNPASVSNTPSRQLTYNYLLPINFWLLLFPADLCCDWTMGTIPVISSIVDPRNLITVAFYACFGKIVHFSLMKQGKLNRAIIMCLALMVMPFIPASNLFFPVGFVVAERILYTPSMGFCMLIAVGFNHIMQNKKAVKPILWFLMGCLVLFHAGKCYMRNIDWTSEYSVFRAALKVNQKNAKLWNNVGHALENLDRYEEALEYFKKAVSVQQDDIGAHMNVGRTYKRLEMFDEAEEAFLNAKNLFPPIIQGKSYTARVAPSHLNVFLNLASLYSRDSSRLEEAASLLKTATDMRPDYIQGYINRGDIYMKMGKRNDALLMYEMALKYEPLNSDAHYNMGVVYMELGQRPEAFKCFEKALLHDPDHWQSLYNSAVMIQEEKMTDKWQVAVDRFQQLIKTRKNDSRAPFSLAMLAMDMQDFIAAEKYFKMSLEREPTFKSAIFNMALMMTNNMGKPKEAVPYVRKLLELYPDHVKGLMLLGELNVNVLKNLDEAEQCFTKVLEHEPSNIEAMHNLCVVFVERGILYKAEKCLAEVHKLAPKEEYILKHLNIVRAKINEYLEKKKAAEAQGQPAGTEGQQGQAAQGQPGQGQPSQDKSQGQAQAGKDQTGKKDGA